jgi:hypothetical protein
LAVVGKVVRALGELPPDRIIKIRDRIGRLDAAKRARLAEGISAFSQLKSGIK